MTSYHRQDREALSALMDGEASASEQAQALRDLQQPQVRADWDTYQLIGQSLRGQHQALRAHDSDFVARIQQAIAAQAQNEAPLSKAIDALPIAASTEMPRASANDRQWLRVASVAGVLLVSAFLARNLWLGGTPDAPAQLAQSAQRALPTQDVASVPQDAVMLRDPQLDAMLAAHRQLAGPSALQTPSGFLRNATFEGVAR
ncbi:MAG: sigma-E factor negative regulatory protein [Rhodoferax sp.]